MLAIDWSLDTKKTIIADIKSKTGRIAIDRFCNTPDASSFCFEVEDAILISILCI